MKKLWNKIKNKISDYLALNKILKNQIEKKNDIIDEQAISINNLLDEHGEDREKIIKVEREKRELKIKVRELTKGDKKYRKIEKLFEGKKVTLKDITKIIEEGE